MVIKNLHSLYNITTPDFIPLIAVFGVNGNGLEVVSYSIYMLGFNVLCGSHVQDTVVFWQFANGSRIGVSNPGFRAGHYKNGEFTYTINIVLALVVKLASHISHEWCSGTC